MDTTVFDGLHHALIGRRIYERAKDVFTSDDHSLRMNAKA
jgi:hypothetical protein